MTITKSLLGMMLCWTMSASGQSDSRTTAFLRQFRTAWSKSFLTAGPSIIQDYYDSAIRLMPEFQKTVMTLPNVMRYHRAFSDRFSVSACSRTAIEVLDLGTRVIEIGSSSMTLALRSSGQTFELPGKYLDVWQRLPGGRLSLITQAWNYNGPVQIGEQLRFQEVPVVNIALDPHLPVNSPIRFLLAAINGLMEVTITAHDASVWSQAYTDDGMFLYSNNAIVHGRKALDSFLEQHARQLPVFEKLDIRNDRIDDLGEYVIEYASHIANWRNGDYSGVGTGKDLAIWKRGPDGSLKIFRHIAMYD